MGSASQSCKLLGSSCDPSTARGGAPLPGISINGAPAITAPGLRPGTTTPGPTRLGRAPLDSPAPKRAELDQHGLCSRFEPPWSMEVEVLRAGQGTGCAPR